MSDTFNHLHYLDKRLFSEIANDAIHFDWESHLRLMKNLFSTFDFVVYFNDKVLYRDDKINLINNHTKSVSNQKVFLIKLHTNQNLSNHEIFIAADSLFIQQDIILQKSEHITKIHGCNNGEYISLNLNLSNQLFYAKTTFSIVNKFNSFFLNLKNKQKNKNEIIYNLSVDSNLIHHTFSDIQESQLSDDSIEVIHVKNSTSKINYESLNRGKVSSQINSVISKNSTGSSTEQNLKHIAMTHTAITNSKPNLMISNSDVIASHGNSIGSFSFNDLFYLQQRGLTHTQCLTVLSESKLNEFISKTSSYHEIKEYIKDKI